jgi:hypothetical protein
LEFVIEMKYQEYKMRTKILLCSLVLATVPALAQNSADQPGTASPQEQQGNAMQGSESMNTMHEGAKKAGPMDGMDKMSTQHEEMMKNEQTDLDAMRAQLQKMRDQTARVSDQSRKEEMQLNNDMWQALIDHTDKHMMKMKNMMEARQSALPTSGNAMSGSSRYSQ